MKTWTKFGRVGLNVTAPESAARAESRNNDSVELSVTPCCRSMYMYFLQAFVSVSEDSPFNFSEHEAQNPVGRGEYSRAIMIELR